MSIQRSDELNELFSALSKLQGKIEKAKKDQSGYKNNYKFADLSQYIDLSQDLLAEHGLVVLQLPTSMEIVEISKEVYDEKTKTYNINSYKMPKQTIITWIGHESGQFISGAMDILVEKLAGMSWGQSTGSAITYGRRYSRAGALGMSQEDDDNQNKKNVGKSNSKETINNNTTPQKINGDMSANLTKLFKGDQERIKKTLEWAKVNKIDDLSIGQYEILIKRLEQEAKENDVGIIQESIAKSDILVTEFQVNFIKRLVTPERLLEILQKYKLTRLEEMKISEYNTLNDDLRLEASPTYKKPGEITTTHEKAA